MADQRAQSGKLPDGAGAVARVSAPVAGQVGSEVGRLGGRSMVLSGVREAPAASQGRRPALGGRGVAVFAASLGLHGLVVLVAAGVRVDGPDARAPLGAGAWVASTVEVGLGSGGGEEVAIPAQGTVAAPEAGATTENVVEPARAEAVSHPANAVNPVSRRPSRPAPSRTPPTVAAGTEAEGRTAADESAADESAADQSGAVPGGGVAERERRDGVAGTGREGRPGFGGMEAADRVGHLPAAFTRALPAAARGDASWHDLATGRAGRWLVRAKLGDDGTLMSLETGSGAAAYVERLLRVSRMLLRAGRFALPSGGSGEQRLGLEVWVERVAAEGDGEPHLVRQLSSRYPEGEEPGEALVTFNSGLRVRLRVFVDPRW